MACCRLRTTRALADDPSPRWGTLRAGPRTPALDTMARPASAGVSPALTMPGGRSVDGRRRGGPRARSRSVALRGRRRRPGRGRRSRAPSRRTAGSARLRLVVQRAPHQDGRRVRPRARARRPPRAGASRGPAAAAPDRPRGPAARRHRARRRDPGSGRCAAYPTTSGPSTATSSRWPVVGGLRMPLAHTIARSGASRASRTSAGRVAAKRWRHDRTLTSAMPSTSEVRARRTPDSGMVPLCPSGRSRHPGPASIG